MVSAGIPPLFFAPLDLTGLKSQIPNMTLNAKKPPLTIRLCGPRGFCAGVDRAIQIVVLALKKYGAPVYVRHEIVHNRYVVEGLQSRGAVFIEELHEIPPEHHTAPVIFSAHGVPKSVPADAIARNLFYMDATCPLVSKVHKQAMLHQKRGRHACSRHILHALRKITHFTSTSATTFWSMLTTTFRQCRS